MCFADEVFPVDRHLLSFRRHHLRHLGVCVGRFLACSCVMVASRSAASRDAAVAGGAPSKTIFRESPESTLLASERLSMPNNGCASTTSSCQVIEHITHHGIVKSSAVVRRQHLVQRVDLAVKVLQHVGVWQGVELLTCHQVV